VSKISKASVHYREKTDLRHCGNCAMYRDRTCSLVAGLIDPDFVCDRWQAIVPLETHRPLYIIRHGATAMNAESGNLERVRGWKNVPLSDKGIAQVKKLAASLEHSKIDLLISSDLLRAHQTANAVAIATGADIVYDKRLRTWSMGEFEGKPVDNVFDDIRKFAQVKTDRKIPGGESFDEFKARIFAALRDVANRKQDCLGIVTHRWVERLVKAWIAQGSPPDHTIDFNVLFQYGEKTANAEKVNLELAPLFA
jgi:broad specificity phosphatase PhoE